MQGGAALLGREGVWTPREAQEARAQETRMRLDERGGENGR
ncbi:hypothetical protein PF004_g16328 [Phytophthora fragariae]|nr:hypothetical protein PF004_g16328 [Phytophthora fragariae]